MIPLILVYCRSLEPVGVGHQQIQLDLCYDFLYLHTCIVDAFVEGIKDGGHQLKCQNYLTKLNMYHLTSPDFQISIDVHSCIPTQKEAVYWNNYKVNNSRNIKGINLKFLTRSFFYPYIPSLNLYEISRVTTMLFVKTDFDSHIMHHTELLSCIGLQ